MVAYRDKLQIIADILIVATKRARKTQIMYQANLSHRLLCRYMNGLMEANLISPENGDFYVLTDKGKIFLDRHETYSKSCRRLRERQDYVEKEKVFLENMSCQENPSRTRDNYSRKSPRKGGNLE
jgi:predicted transcriptional regulator